MIAEIKKSTLRGTIIAPPSKSMTHRLLICGGLANGKSIIKGVALSEDIKATLGCLKSIGAEYTYENDEVIIDGTNVNKSIFEFNLNCNESGSTLRFFIPICSVLNKKTTFYGSKTLLQRPLSVYENIFSNQNIEFSNDGEKVLLNGKLKSGKYKIKGNISSQFISGLLFALPMLNGDSEITILPPIESRSYIDLTIKALERFGIKIEWSHERTIFIRGNQQYVPQNVTVEGDYSNTAFFEALNYFDNDVKIEGLNENSIQGDKAYLKFFPMLQKGTPTIHLGGCPDLGPILFALSAAKNGAIFTGTKRLKLKESDRSSAMAEELSKMGVSVKIEEDSVLIYPINFKAPSEMLYGHNDHRIVMALAVLLTFTGGKIKGVEAVKKSMPDFFTKLQSIGADIKFTYE